MTQEEKKEFLDTLNRIIEYGQENENLEKFISKVYEKWQNDLINSNVMIKKIIWLKKLLIQLYKTFNL